MGRLVLGRVGLPGILFLSVFAGGACGKKKGSPEAPQENRMGEQVIQETAGAEGATPVNQSQELEMPAGSFAEATPGAGADPLIPEGPFGPFHGFWRSGCLASAEGYYRIETTLVAGGKIAEHSYWNSENRATTFYDDAACTARTVIVREVSLISKDVGPAVDGFQELSYFTSSILALPYLERVAKRLNELQVCGFTNWVDNFTRFPFGVRCNFFGLTMEFGKSGTIHTRKAQLKGGKLAMGLSADDPNLGISLQLVSRKVD